MQVDSILQLSPRNYQVRWTEDQRDVWLANRSRYIPYVVEVAAGGLLLLSLILAGGNCVCRERGRRIVRPIRDVL